MDCLYHSLLFLGIATTTCIIVSCVLPSSWHRIRTLLVYSELLEDEEKYHATTNLHANSTAAVSTTKSEGMEPEEKSVTPIAYTMTGGEIANITVVKENATLLLDIVTNVDGPLILKYPRNIIDSKSPQNEDEDYILFADGLQIGADEIITNDQVRTLSIDFDNRVKQIEIIGSSPISEPQASPLPLSNLSTITTDLKSR
jgi:hypothetical protein